MAELLADPTNEETTADGTMSCTSVTSEAVKPGSDGTIEDAVRRSMNDLERELEQEREGDQRQTWA